LYALFVVGLYVGPNGPQASLYSRSAAVGIAIFVLLAARSAHVKYSRVLDFLSSISYPLYLLHGVNGYVLLRWLEAHGISYYIGLPVALAAAIAGAVAVHYAIERPVIRLGRRIGSARRSKTPAPV